MQEFVSFGVNQIKWLKAYSAFQRQENRLDLWVRAEHRDPLQLWNKHRSFMRTLGMIDALGPIHRSINWQVIEYFFTIKDLTIAAAKFQYQTSNSNIQLREPFNYEKFKLDAECLSLYGELILRAVPSWLGYMFWSPIIWHLAPRYQALYEMPEGQTSHVFEHLLRHHGCRPPHVIPSPTYSLTSLHVNYNVFMRA